MFLYEGPSQALKRIAAAVGALGSILPIDPPFGNASWDLKFGGPAIRCDPLPLSERLSVQRSIMEYLRPGSGNCHNPSGYITFFLWKSAIHTPIRKL